MSRSRRKTPITGVTTCRSERLDKIIWHRRFRARQRTIMRSFAPDVWDDKLPWKAAQIVNIWSMGKDGHIFYSNLYYSPNILDPYADTDHTENEQKDIKDYIRRIYAK
jgi:hypothetical protein